MKLIDWSLCKHQCRVDIFKSTHPRWSEQLKLASFWHYWLRRFGQIFRDYNFPLFFCILIFFHPSLKVKFFMKEFTTHQWVSWRLREAQFLCLFHNSYSFWKNRNVGFCEWEILIYYPQCLMIFFFFSWCSSILPLPLTSCP